VLIGAGLVGTAVAGIAVGILVSNNRQSLPGRGSGVPATEVRSLPAFSAVELAGATALPCRSANHSTWRSAPTAIC
jgi:hypothetical protein